MKYIYLRGQSLFEVMFAIGIAALVLIAIVSLSTRAVKTSDFQEIIHWLQSTHRKEPNG